MSWRYGIKNKSFWEVFLLLSLPSQHNAFIFPKFVNPFLFSTSTHFLNVFFSLKKTKKKKQKRNTVCKNNFSLFFFWHLLLLLFVFYIRYEIIYCLFFVITCRSSMGLKYPRVDKEDWILLSYRELMVKQKRRKYFSFSLQKLP